MRIFDQKGFIYARQKQTHTQINENEVAEQRLLVVQPSSNTSSSCTVVHELLSLERSDKWLGWHRRSLDLHCHMPWPMCESPVITDNLKMFCAHPKGWDKENQVMDGANGRCYWGYLSQAGYRNGLIAADTGTSSFKSLPYWADRIEQEFPTRCPRAPWRPSCLF